MDLIRRVTGAAKPAVDNDASFGPQFGQAFDFTMVFNNSILAILPSLVMILASIVYIFWYQKKPAVTRKRDLFWIKAMFVCCLMLCEIARSIVWSFNENTSSDTLATTSIAASVFSNIGSLMLGVALYYDHFYALQSTSFLSLFLVVSICTETSRARSFFLRPGMGRVAGLSLGCIVAKVILAVLLEVPKTLDAPDYKDKTLVPDDTVGFWGRMFIWWANTIFFRGFRNHLTMDDLGALEPSASSEHLAQQFEPTWMKADKTGRYALFKACLRVHFWLIFAAGVPCVVLTVLRYLAVFAMKATLNAVKDPSTATATRIGLICANVLVYAALAATNSQYMYSINQLSVRLGGTLTSQMIKKNAKLAVKGATKRALLTHITADVDGIIAAIPEMYEVALSLPALAVGFYFLYTVIGNAFFLPALPLLFSTIVGLYTGKNNQPATRQWNQSIQNRVAKSAQILAQITGIKMMGLQTIVADLIQSLRLKEVADSMWARKLRVMMVGTLPLNYWFTPTVVFVGGVYWTVWNPNGLDAVTPWVVLGIVGLVRLPMWYLLKSWPIIGALFACFDRIQAFLQAEERKDQRQLRCFSQARASTSSKASTNKTETKTTAFEEEMKNRSISLSMVTVPSDESNENILENLDLSIPACKLTVVVGPVGSGKTVFLKALIGEAPFSSGSIHASSLHMAYCAQKAWLPSGTVRNAIVAQNAFDEERYNTVLTACALDTDLKALVGGDQYNIGPNGARLSGGQRQRLALARAIYSLCPIVVCDDVLRALDARTARHIFKAVFGVEGILKKQDRTAVFATHERTWLSSADQIIHFNKERVATVHKGRQAVEKFLRANGREVGFRMGSTLASSSEPEASAPDKMLEYARQDNEKPADKLDTSLYRYLLMPVSIWLLLLSAFLIMFNGVMERGPELYVRVWIEENPTNRRCALGMLALSFFSICSAAFSSWVFQVVIVPKISLYTHAKFSKTVMKATLQFLMSTSNGAIVNRSSQDMTLLGQEMPQALYGALAITAIYLTNIAFIVAGTDYTAAIIPVLFIILWVLQDFYLRTSRQLRLLELEAKTPLFNSVGEMITGLEHIRSYRRDEKLVRQSLELLNDSQKAYYHMITIQRWLTFVLDVLGVVMVAILMSVALVVVDSTSQAALGLSMINLTAFAILNKQVIEGWTKMETSLGAVKRLKDFELNTPCEEDGPNTRDPPPDWPAQGRIEFKNVSAYYGSGPDVPPALERVSVTMNPGQKVIVRGRTGSGKSTILLAMLNLLHLEGKILIDGLDITEMPHDKLRAKITTLPQDSIELPETIRNNLMPFNILDSKSCTVSEDVIESVLQDVALWDHINAKGGLDTAFEDMHFSSGQRQIFNIARAMLHHLQFDTKIVLMDEITSSLDYETRESLEQTMKVAFGDCTRVIVSHNMADTMDCDVILTLSNGWLVETDLVYEIGEHLSRLFSEIIGIPPTVPYADPEFSKWAASQSTAAQDTTAQGSITQGPDQIQPQDAAASEGEQPIGALISATKPIDIQANARLAYDSDRGRSHRRSSSTRASSRRSSRESASSEASVYLESPSSARGKSGGIISRRARSTPVRVFKHHREAPPRPGPAPTNEMVLQAYFNTAVMDTGETRARVILRRSDIAYRQHQEPYPVRLPTEKEMIDEDATLSGEEGKKRRERKKRRMEAKMKARDEAALAEFAKFTAAAEAGEQSETNNEVESGKISDKQLEEISEDKK